MGFPYEAKILRESGCVSIYPIFPVPTEVKGCISVVPFFPPMDGDVKSNALFSCPAQMKLR